MVWSASASGSEPFTRALGVECDFCHTAADWKDSSKAPFTTARRMADMVAALNGAQLAGTTGVECWTCHAGSRRPSRLPPAALAEQGAKWPSDVEASDRVKLAMNVYSVSLGVSCDHCHVSGDWKAADKRPFTMVKTMAAMFAEFPKYMPPGAQTQCWMCHKGSTNPQRRP